MRVRINNGIDEISHAEKINDSAILLRGEKTRIVKTGDETDLKIHMLLVHGYADLSEHQVSDMETDDVFDVDQCPQSQELSEEERLWISNMAQKLIIAFAPYNVIQKVNLQECFSDDDVKYHVLENVSGLASCDPVILNGMNKFLGTNFSRDDVHKIHMVIGYGWKHEKTEEFVSSGYSMQVLD